MSRSYRLCCITKNGTNPAYLGARVGATRTADLLGGIVEHFFPGKPDDVSEQEALIRLAIKSNPDAILLAPTHPTALNGIIGKIVESAIPLVCFVSEPEGISPQTFVTSNNREMARAIARYLIESIGDAGDLAIIEGSPNSTTSLSRTEGFHEAVAAFPEVRVVAQSCGYYQRENARQAMAEILDQHPRIDGVLAANDFMAFGVYDALSAANRRATLVGINAMPEAITAIKAGRMQATAAFDAMKLACVATEAAFRILAGEQVPDLIELPVDIVDASNCDEWDRPYEERPLPEWKRIFGADSREALRKNRIEAKNMAIK